MQVRQKVRTGRRPRVERLAGPASDAPTSSSFPHEEFAMLFHVSIEADDPQHVAEVIAELWGGEALPFPAVIDGSWAALAGDERSTLVEVYPRGTELHPTSGDAIGLLSAHRRHNPTHIAIATQLSSELVFAICKREGWEAKYCKRGGAFGVIEIFMEGCQMIEVLTPEMQQEYLDAITIPNWKAMLAAGEQLAGQVGKLAA
jgi:hypothetical protein